MYQLAKAMIKESLRALKKGRGYDGIVALTEGEARVMHCILKSYDKLLNEMSEAEMSEADRSSDFLSTIIEHAV